MPMSTYVSLRLYLIVLKKVVQMALNSIAPTEFDISY